MKINLENRLRAARILAAVEAHQDSFRLLVGTVQEAEGRSKHYTNVLRGDISDSESKAREKFEESFRNLLVATAAYQGEQEEILKILLEKNKT